MKKILLSIAFALLGISSSFADRVGQGHCCPLPP